MAHRWIEDDPMDDGLATLVAPSDGVRARGVASVLGFGSVVSVLLLLLTTIALVD